MLRIHPTAQRDGVIKSKLAKIERDLDLDAIGTLHVVEYAINGETAKWVIDGQHRLLALLASGMGDWEVRIEVHVDVKDDARASQLFLELNERTSVQPLERFRNELQSGEPMAVNISALANRHGFQISSSSQEGTLACPVALKKVYSLDGGESLDKTLGTIVSAWGHTMAAREGKLIEGLGLLFHRNNGAVDKPVLTTKLAKFPGGPAGLIGSAKGLAEYKKVSLSRCIAEVMTDTYNKGRSVQLEKP